MAGGNRTFKHVSANTAAGGASLSVNQGVILGAVVINTPGGAGNVLTLYDGQSTSGNVIAVCKVDQASLPALEYGVIAPSGLWYTLLGGSAADLTITFI